MITRQQYLNGDFTHDEYYAQFVTQYTKNIVRSLIRIDLLIKSTDKNLNDIPLKKWDNLPTTGSKLRECGDYPTQAGIVCIYKASAKQIIEELKSE